MGGRLVIKNLGVLILFLALNTALLADGKTRYDTKCRSCHGLSGHLKALGFSRPIGGMPKNELRTLIEGYKAGNINHYGLGATMKNRTIIISEDTIDELATYISNLQPAQSTKPKK
jgi:cytochrome c